MFSVSAEEIARDTATTEVVSKTLPRMDGAQLGIVGFRAWRDILNQETHEVAVQEKLTLGLGSTRPWALLRPGLLMLLVLPLYCCSTGYR